MSSHADPPRPLSEKGSLPCPYHLFVARCGRPGHDVIVRQPEEPLAGTNVSVVARVGETLCRSRKPSTEAVQSLLRHLRDSGFAGCPAPLGFDDQGREVLSYVQGTGGTLPLRPETVTDKTLIELAPIIHGAV